MIPLVVAQVGDLDARSIYVDLSIVDEIKSFRLDTGAYLTDLQTDAQTERFGEYGDFFQPGLSGLEAKCAWVLIPRMRFGGETRLNFWAIRCNGGAHVVNNLGLSLMESSILHFDIRHSRLIVDAPEFAAGDRTYPLGRLGPAGEALLKLPLSIGGIEADGVFDTGTAITTVDSKFVEENSSAFQLVAEGGRSSDINGQPLRVAIYQVKEMRIGNLELKGIYVAALDFSWARQKYGTGTPVIIGNNVILRANWKLDLLSHRWAVEPF